MKLGYLFLLSDWVDVVCDCVALGVVFERCPVVFVRFVVVPGLLIETGLPAFRIAASTSSLDFGKKGVKGRFSKSFSNTSPSTDFFSHYNPFSLASLSVPPIAK